jgi:hypothetical protein
VKVTLLGGIAKPWGEKALEKAKAYAVKYSNLVFFEKELVDQEAFDRIMHGAHFIFSPIVAEILVSDGVTEKFGSSKATGNTGDIVRFARPSILPRHLLLPNELIESATCYTHIKEIPDQLQQIRDNPSIYSALREAAYNCSMQFRIAAIHNRYPELFKAGS